MKPSIEICGCCEGIEIVTPQPTANRPGLSTLSYRIGTHATFLETMLARLSSSDYPALADLRTRAADDPSIALLDAWAIVADVLTFYNERLVNEGYLRTATERRSILELARLVGYKLRPGVASSVYLAYTLDDNFKDGTIIPKGARSQSIPGPGELPQSFEISEDLKARAQWNSLKPRMTRPQKIALENVLTIERMYVEGTAVNLKVNDHLLFVFDKGADKQAVRRVKEAIPWAAENKTEIRFQTIFSDIDSASLSEAILNWLTRFSSKLNTEIEAQAFDDESAAKRALKTLWSFQKRTFLGAQPNALELPGKVFGALDTNDAALINFISLFLLEFKKLIKTPSPLPLEPIANLAQLFIPLLKLPSLQPINSVQLNRKIDQLFHPKSDVTPQLLVNFSPTLNSSFYGAWANADVNSAISALQAVYVLRVSAPLFGYNAAKKMALIPNPNELVRNQIPFISAIDGDWSMNEAGDEDSDQLFLDNAYDGVLSGSYALIETRDGGTVERLVMPIKSVQVRPRTAYGLSAKTTQLTFNDDWRDPQSNDMELIRRSLVYTQSEPLKLAEQPIEQDIGFQDPDPDATGKRIELGELYPGLESGRWMVVSGERSDIPGTSGVIVNELVMLSSVEQGFDNTLPGDKTLSTLVFANSLAYAYKRDTVKIYGNVVKATHGETRKEVLGSGDGAKALQTFMLKQPPLTYVSAANPAGVDSTLKVYVNDVQWHETDALAGLASTERKFITKTDDDGKDTIIFGNGRDGARLPTGIENIKAEYRNGIGKPGNVKAGQVSLLISRPLGVKEVINPLPANGGADKESREQARKNAPLAVKALDRLVSVQDYEDFARTFAGIGKARAAELSDGRRQLVHVTIAGADDIPIDKNADLYRNLRQALLNFGDPLQIIRLEVRELMLIVLEARIRILPDYLWEPVVTQVRAALLDAFSFERRELGQDVLLSEALSIMQAVRGVAYVDVDVLRGIPEKVVDAVHPGERRLLTPGEIADLIGQPLLDKDGNKIKEPVARIAVNLADTEEGAIRPAQLAFLTVDVPATLILNQIT